MYLSYFRNDSEVDLNKCYEVILHTSHFQIAIALSYVIQTQANLQTVTKTKTKILKNRKKIILKFDDVLNVVST